MELPAWLDQAWREVGVREIDGPESNPRILSFYRDVGQAQIASEDVAWCAAFVGACLERAGLRGTRSLLARSYLDWGTPLTEPRQGAIAVLSRGADPGQGHVGFIVGEQQDNVLLLGGNQDNAVTVEPYARSRLIGLRWPEGQAMPSDPGDPLARFDTALQHVLEMEGGYSNDPYDPGGPTNLGITLAVYAAFKKVEPTSQALAALKAEIKTLDVGIARQIYLTRYWAPSRSPLLPDAVALMHFDAAVNHGVGRAARILQEAAGVTVDGEIGPETLSAVRTPKQLELLRRYADVRRKRYRSLAHFWRFGRGWLARVDKTLARAESLIETEKRSNQQRSNGESEMADSETTEPQAKWWGESLTIWGTIVTALSTVVPVLGPLIGIDISSDLVQQLGEQVVRVAQALGGLIGIGLTIYGRTRATTKLERREITLQV